MIDNRDAAADDLEVQQFQTEHSLVGWSQEAERQVEQIHVGGDGMQFVCLAVVGCQPMPWAGVEPEQLRDGVQKINELRQ
jgi:hypothetical protein